MTYKAIIVDDEQLAREMLQDMLTIVNDSIKIEALCEDIPEAVKAINKYKPDIVFIDVDMPRYKGIHITEFFDEIDFCIVFTTAHQEYAIDAIKINAFDYLLKPIDIEEMSNTVEKFIKYKESIIPKFPNQEKLKVNTTQVVHFIDLDDIIYFKADGSYTQIICNNDTITASKNLKFYEQYLSHNQNFLRCHKSYIVNKSKVSTLNKIKQEITLSNGDKINISIEKIDSLVNY